MIMQRSNPGLLALTLVGALATGSMAAYAQTKPATPDTAAAVADKKAEAETHDILKFSADGNAALHEIEAARLSIFSGKPDAARAEIGKARDKIHKGASEAARFVAEANPGKAPTKVEMLPVDGQLIAYDDFVPTDDKNAHVAAANQQLEKGARPAAAKEFKLADVRIVYNRVWMPIDLALRRLDQAEKLMGEHKYYEANLALRSIGDHLSIESDSMTDEAAKPNDKPAAGAADAKAANPPAGKADAQPGK